MKQIDKISEQERAYHRELIWLNTKTLFQKKNSMTPKSIINSQISYINQLSIRGKNKFKSVDILRNYFNNPNKLLAEQVFWNTLNKKINI